ncbi:hypothetical protein D777_02697 [Marinobacter nitratireducens]|uniref:Uncharacterized protein n=1 Tax=Marinobacter nitratireducens TaxID=1137280 RepID=A0A072NCD2_9GAMM|nr:hypothetical protein D777_02697 [Marinobacter nitratireducens]
MPGKNPDHGLPTGKQQVYIEKHEDDTRDLSIECSASFR